MRLIHTTGRVMLLVTASLLSSVCYAVTIRAHLGLGPLYVLQDGVARRLGMSIGHAVMIVGVALCAVAMLVRWRPGIGTLALPFMGGFFLDAALPHVGNVHGVAARVLAVVVATWLMALGGALMIKAAIGFSAFDGIMIGIHRRTARPLAPTRLGMEITVLALGALLGGAFGVGTLITGALIGPGLQWWMRVIGASPTGVTTRAPEFAAA